MKPVEPQELLPLREYLNQREAIRRRMIRVRRDRRVEVGPEVSLGFENRETVIYQVHEMLRAEHIEDPQRIQEELDIYNELLPGENGLSATLFIEVPDSSLVRETLNRMIGVDEHVHLRIGSLDVLAESEPGRSTQEKTASVHYIRFPLGPAGRDALLAARPGEVWIAIDHPHYRHEALVGERQLAELKADLSA